MIASLSVVERLPESSALSLEGGDGHIHAITQKRDQEVVDGSSGLALVVGVEAGFVALNERGSVLSSVCSTGKNHNEDTTHQVTYWRSFC